MHHSAEQINVTVAFRIPWTYPFYMLAFEYLQAFVLPPQVVFVQQSMNSFRSGWRITI